MFYNKSCLNIIHTGHNTWSFYGDSLQWSLLGSSAFVVEIHTKLTWLIAREDKLEFIFSHGQTSKKMYNDLNFPTFKIVAFNRYQLLLISTDRSCFRPQYHVSRNPLIVSKMKNANEGTGIRFPISVILCISWRVHNSVHNNVRMYADLEHIYFINTFFMILRAPMA
jgi:hypothetical protein